MTEITKPKHACMMDGQIMLMFYSKETAARFVRKMRMKGYDVHYAEINRND